MHLITCKHVYNTIMTHMRGRSSSDEIQCFIYLFNFFKLISLFLQKYFYEPNYWPFEFIFINSILKVILVKLQYEYWCR